MEMLLSVENKYLMAFITVNIAKKTFEYKTMETWPEEKNLQQAIYRWRRKQGKNM